MRIILFLFIAIATAQDASISDALLINKNLKTALNVSKEFISKNSKGDSLTASEIWFVPNGMSIPNYMLRASREIQRCNGKIHWMREIRGGKAALLKYEGEQGVYPLTEIRIIDSLWLPNSSKLAIVLAAREQNTLLKNKPELLKNLNFNHSLLIPSSRKALLDAGKKINANIIPWVPMESKYLLYDTEKKSQIPIGIASERELEKKLDAALENFGSVNGFAAFYGEDFLAHPASIEKLGNVLQTKKLWFWDLSKRGSATLSLDECKKKGLKCHKDHLDAESDEQIRKALRTARINGSAILLFELSEKSIDLLKKLPELAEKQGTSLTFAHEVF
ncbi:MAG: divergent polysaccharide deacetylase family protein [Fibromonadaceae bacterium]|jgi:polysaccharide deacetylase 2 family uncharacterized protein YibQ|nr:divergent polysaccharide deacetylase family protein [Fibromonadaceae bacterium]